MRWRACSKGTPEPVSSEETPASMAASISGVSSMSIPASSSMRRRKMACRSLRPRRGSSSRISVVLTGQAYTMRSWRATSSACLLRGETPCPSRRLNLAQKASVLMWNRIQANESLPELIMEQLLPHLERFCRRREGQGSTADSLFQAGHRGRRRTASCHRIRLRPARFRTEFLI